MHIVYQTTNLINGKIYVGVSNGNNENYLGSGIALKRALNKYGWDKFERTILFECEDGDEAYWLERFIVNKGFIKLHDSYNAKVGGYSGYFHTAETRKKISKTKTKMNRKMPEHVKIALQLGLKRKREEDLRNGKIIKKKMPPTKEETRQKLSELSKRNWQNPEYVKKVMNGRKNIRISEETKEKHRQRMLGTSPSKETRRKIGLNNPHRKPIILIVNDEPLLLFESIAEASRITGYKENAIRNTVKGRCEKNGKWFGNKFVWVKWEYEKRDVND